jgi:hypothetical protein
MLFSKPLDCHLVLSIAPKVAEKASSVLIYTWLNMS